MDILGMLQSFEVRGMNIVSISQLSCRKAVLRSFEDSSGKDGFYIEAKSAVIVLSKNRHVIESTEAIGYVVLTQFGEIALIRVLDTAPDSGLRDIV
jgi:hypothetical protein